jgi:hypothetical protein
MGDQVSAAAFHGVRETTTGTEIGFLVLAVPPPDDAMHAPGNAEQFAQGMLETPDITAKELSGHQVWFAEDPTRPNSRFQYVWLRHGTIGWLDGPDQAALEQFLTAYFAVPFQGAEDPVLAQRMVDLPGYAFTNAVDRTDEQAAAEDLFPGATASMHYVFDQTHMFGGLVLVGPVADMSDDELIAHVAKWSATTTGESVVPKLQAQGDIPVGDVTIHHVANTTTGINYYVWRWPNTSVVGWLASARPDIAATFLPAFVAAQPAP